MNILADSTHSFMFAASRNLYALAITGHAPKIFARCSKRGIPYFAVCTVFAFTMLSFLLLSERSSVVSVHSIPVLSLWSF